LAGQGYIEIDIDILITWIIKIVISITTELLGAEESGKV